MDPLWKKMTDYFGIPHTAAMVHASESEVRQHLWRKKDADNGIRDRAMFLLKIIDCLEGSYNAKGVTRWFYRRRDALSDKSPFMVFCAEWTPDLPGPVRVMELAEQLVGSGGAT